MCSFTPASLPATFTLPSPVSTSSRPSARRPSPSRRRLRASARPPMSRRADAAVAGVQVEPAVDALDLDRAVAAARADVGRRAAPSRSASRVGDGASPMPLKRLPRAAASPRARSVAVLLRLDLRARRSPPWSGRASRSPPATSGLSHDRISIAPSKVVSRSVGVPDDREPLLFARDLALGVDRDGAAAGQ